MADFYAYIYLREDGTPYYVGKGCGDRAFHKHERINPPKDRSRIFIIPRKNEDDALECEKCWIILFGRKDLGTGCLRNLTDGGDGVSGHRMSNEARLKMSKAAKQRGPDDSRLKNLRPGTEILRQWRAAGNAAPNLGRKFSKETRRRMSEAGKRRCLTPEGLAHQKRIGDLGRSSRWGG